MSVFIVADSSKKEYVCKLIDLVSFEHLPEDKRHERDQGIIKGLVNLIQLLQNIHDGED